jgi:beta-N-acetylhexosaminidase
VSLGPLMIDLRGCSLAGDEREWLGSPLVGGVLLFSRNYANRVDLTRLIEEIHAIRQPPLLVAVDHEGGRVQRFREEFFRLPPMRMLGHLYDEDRAAALDAAASFGWLMAAELRAVGIDLSFAPVVERDLGLAEVIGDRALHVDAEVVAALATRFTAGVKRAGMTVTAKHFPTHAGVRSDSHTEVAVDKRDYSELTDDLRPYRKLIANGLLSIMVAHVSFPKVDPLPASLSPWWVDTVLRGELGFTGAVISDDLSMTGASVAGSVAERVQAALRAGCDLVLVCNAPDAIPSVLEALRGYVNPPGQLRLARLHGRAAPTWEALHESAEWSGASRLLGRLLARRELELHG